MKATVLVEKLGKKKYRAVTAQPVPMESIGTSHDEALDRLRDLARVRLAAGQLVELNLPGLVESNPWTTLAGIWKDHPDFDEFRENIAAYRRSVDRQEKRS